MFQALKGLGGLGKLVKLVSLIVGKLEHVDVKNCLEAYLIQHDLRLALNILFNFMVMTSQNLSETESFNEMECAEIESFCLRAFKLAQELEIVPVKKFLIILRIYLNLLFGTSIKHPTIQITKDRLTSQERGRDVTSDKKDWFMKENVDALDSENFTPRFVLPTSNPVEKFYKRLMRPEQPISSI